MDQATQQNAALVEESAAAAESLKHQALQLVRAVAVFKLSAGMPDSCEVSDQDPPSMRPILNNRDTAEQATEFRRRMRPDSK